MFSDQLKAKPLLPMEEIFPAKFCIPIPPGHLLQRHSYYKTGGPKGKELGCKRSKNGCAKVTGGDLRWTMWVCAGGTSVLKALGRRRVEFPRLLAASRFLSPFIRWWGKSSQNPMSSDLHAFF